MKISNFGERVRESRLKLNISQTDMAKTIGISRNYLSQIERGEAQNISWQVKTKIEEELGISQIKASLPHTLPAGLKEFAEQEELQPDDILMLQKLEYRGKKPQTSEQWKFLYKVIRSVLEDN